MYLEYFIHTNKSKERKVYKLKNTNLVMQKKVTLSFDERTYEKFKKFCNDHAIMLSKKLELEMEKIMSSKGGKNE